MSNFETFRSNLFAAAALEADWQEEQDGDDDNAAIIRKYVESRDEVKLIEKLNKMKSKLSHDTFKSFLVEQIPGADDEGQDCATHDFRIRTRSGGNVRVETKSAAVRNNNRGVMTNKDGDSVNMHLAALVTWSTRSISKTEMLVVSSSVLRRVSSTYGVKGWQLSITPRKAEGWRQSGLLTSFDEGLAKLHALANSEALRRYR